MTDYTLHYWPIPFRGHFIRMILAQVGARWDEPGAEVVAEAKNVPVDQQPYPYLAPPLLIDHSSGKRLSQMPAIAMYLGRKHHILGDPDESLRLLCDANDILFEITRGHGAQMWDRASWSVFIANRLPRWMRIHERVAQQNGLKGDAPDLASLTLTALWHTMVDRLPELRPVLHDHAPQVEAVTDRIASAPAQAEMLNPWKGRSPRYCGGQIEQSILDMLNGGKDA